MEAETEEMLDYYERLQAEVARLYMQRRPDPGGAQ